MLYNVKMIIVVVTGMLLSMVSLATLGTEEKPAENTTTIINEVDSLGKTVDVNSDHSDASKVKAKEIGETIEESSSEETNSEEINSEETNSEESEIRKEYPSFFSEEDDKQDRPKTSTGDLGKMVGSLLGVIVIILIFAVLSKKMGVKGVIKSRGLDIKMIQSLGPKERLVVIEVYGKTMLLGATPQAINNLYTFTEAELVEYEANQESSYSSGEASGSSTLQQKILNKLMSVKNERAVSKFEKMLDQEKQDPK